MAHMDGSMEITEGDNRYLSRYVRKTETCCQVVGLTISVFCFYNNYRELMEGSRTNLRAGDIFALGATIYELALGTTLPNGGEDWQRIRDGDLVMFRYEACVDYSYFYQFMRLT